MPAVRRKPVILHRYRPPASHTLEPHVSRRSFMGLRVPSSVIDDLNAAVDLGARIEVEGDGLVIYPPDKEASPIRWYSRKSNPAHENNLHLALKRAGLSHDTDAEVIDLTDKEPPVKRTTKTPANLVAAESLRSVPPGFAINPGDRYEQGMRQAHDALRDAGINEDTLALAVMVQGTMLEWDRARGRYENEDVKAAEALASEAEARAVRAEKALEKLQGERDELSRLYKEARDRATQEAARADGLEAALAPLRKILGGAA